jgi:hypothetical protein
MFNREYFEKVLGEQVQSMGQSATVKVLLADERELEVRSVFACHDAYAILQVYPAREQLGSDERTPFPERWVFDQVAIPYETVIRTEVTTAEPEDATKPPIGFHAK